MANNPKKLIPIVLAGGASKRMHPFTSENSPKQFLELNENGDNLLKKTINRLSDKNIFNEPIIITNKNYKELIDNSLGQSNEIRTIYEKQPFNTAFAFALATSFSAKIYDEDNILGFFPSDHFFNNENLFLEKIKEIKLNELKNNILLFGIKPKEINSNFGYVICNEEETSSNNSNILNFLEKPNSEQIKKIKSQNVFWNSGIYIGSTKTFKNNFRKYSPDIWKAAENVINELNVKENNLFIKKEIKLENKTPFDKAISEKSDNLILTELEDGIGWEDIGTIEKFKKLKEKLN